LDIDTTISVWEQIGATITPGETVAIDDIGDIIVVGSFHIEFAGSVQMYKFFQVPR